MSIVARRRNTSSLHSSLGSMRSFLQLGVDQLVDVVGRRRRGRRVLQVLGQHEHLAADGVRGEAGHDERLAAGRRPSPGRRALIGAELSLFVRNTARFVTSRSVPSEYLARAMNCCVAPLPSSTALRRIELERRRPWPRRPASLGAPASSQRSKRLVVLAVGGEPLAAGVRHAAVGLLHQQALARQRQIDAAEADLAREAVMVAVGIEAEQRQVEAVLAAGRAVATAGVAAGPHEDRHHVELEADRPIDRRVLDRRPARCTVWP